MTHVNMFLRLIIYVKSSFKLYLMVSLIFFKIAMSANVNQLDFDKFKEHYMNLQKDENQRLNYFKKQFKEALVSPENLASFCTFYTDGLDIHISYTEFGPSFCAYVDLHQGLYRAIQNIDVQSMPIPQEICDDFKQASKIFFSNINKLFLVKSIEKFKENLHNNL